MLGKGLLNVAGVVRQDNRLRRPIPEGYGYPALPTVTPLRPLLARALAGKRKGVKLFRPLPDNQMSEVYRRARVHLYPSDERDLLCTTLGDSQAVGLPAVACDKGAAPERLLNGKSGYLVTKAEDFAEFTVRLLEDDATNTELCRLARTRQRNRNWDQVAADFERVLS